MKVTILGNNSALPAHDRHPTSQVVSVWGEDILLDCGEGTQIQMQRFDVRWRKIEHIFISHLHGDHYFGLIGLLTSMSLLGRTAPLYLHAPAPLQKIIEVLLEPTATVFAYPFFFESLPESGEGLLVDHKLYTVSCFPTQHRLPCYGFIIERKTKGRKLLPANCNAHNIPAYFYDRLKNGEDYEAKDGTIVKNEWVTESGPAPKRYAYCADTIYTETLLPYIKGVDTMYHESTYLNADEDRATARFHSTAAQAAQLAKAAGVTQLLLGHYSSKYRDVSLFRDEAAVIFPNVQATVEGAAYEI